MREKRAKFVRLAESRTSRAMQAIRTIGNLANKSNYEYSEQDVRAIRKALLSEVDAMASRFSNADSRSRPTFSLGHSLDRAPGDRSRGTGNEDG